MRIAVTLVAFVAQGGGGDESTGELTNGLEVEGTYHELGVAGYTEFGVSAAYGLNFRGTDEVTIFMSDPDFQVMGVDDANLANAYLTFGPTNWSRPQSVRVLAVDDDLEEGPHSSVITHTVFSSDADYQSIAVDSVTVQVADDDAPTQLGVIRLLELSGVDPSQGPLWYELATSQRGILSIKAINRPAGGTVSVSLFAENRQQPPLADVVSEDGAARLRLGGARGRGDVLSQADRRRPPG